MVVTSYNCFVNFYKYTDSGIEVCSVSAIACILLVIGSASVLADTKQTQEYTESRPEVCIEFVLYKVNVESD